MCRPSHGRQRAHPPSVARYSTPCRRGIARYSSRADPSMMRMLVRDVAGGTPARAEAARDHNFVVISQTAAAPVPAPTCARSSVSFCGSLTGGKHVPAAQTNAWALSA